MSSKQKDSHKKQRRKQEQRWRDEALASIGFQSMAELARIASVNDGDLAGIARGVRRPSRAVAVKLILAIQEHNYQQGWTYITSAHRFREAFNYLRSHFASHSGKPVLLLRNSDVDEWYLEHLTHLNQLQTAFDEPFGLIATYISPEASLQQLLAFLKSWEMKHDFGYLGKIKQRFKDNKTLVIRPAIIRGMEEEECYDLIRAVYTEIRHIAHLCEAFELVHEMSNWLGDRAAARKDIHTEIQVKVTQAWMLTSCNAQESLYEAQKLIQDIRQLIHTNSFLSTVSTEHMDVVAILAELRLRLAIRLDKKRACPLGRERFEEILKESSQLLTQPHSFNLLTPRLKSRYCIPLDYQHGVYLYHLKDYEGAQAKFEMIVEQANYIGWTRVEQAAYSWLATQFEALGDHDRCTEMLDKINVLCLQKRQLISQHIRARIMGDE